MVGKRSQAFSTTRYRPVLRGRRVAHAYRDDDEEAAISRTGRQPSHRRNGSGGADGQRLDLKDAASAVVAAKRRKHLKDRIIDGLDEFGNLEKWRKSDEELKAFKNKKLRKFYETQNDRLDDWLEVDALVCALADDVIDSMNPDADQDGVAERRGPLQRVGGGIDDFLPPEHREKRRRDEQKARWAINVNIIANILLLAGKLISIRFSPSLSLIASTVDSTLDLFCTLIVWGTSRVVAWRLTALKNKFPTGRRRLEPLGILVFSVIMVVSFIQILQESAKKLLPGGDREVASLPPVAIGAMAANAVIKGIIGLLCLPIKTTQVQALVQDCKTDFYFNIASLAFPLIGVTANVWWLDPVGASLLALYVIFDWAETCIENISRLMGSNVEDALQKKLMYLAYRFSPVVAGYKTMTAYHAGDGVWVELDVLLDEKTPLPLAHDVAETLQYCYEGMVEVDRAFVTIDYSSLGPLGHVE